MRTKPWMIVTVSALVVGLAGCGGNDSPGSTASGPNPAEVAPPPPSTSDFSSYAQTLVTTYSCDTNPPAETNSIDFTFVASADTAYPVDTSGDVAACTV